MIALTCKDDFLERIRSTKGFCI
uniref:Uncharacterized protein n=1 Tax=Anguilla anguilla TaxID=7936 RepID=A0A0E9PNW1_ANGAN